MILLDKELSTEVSTIATKEEAAGIITKLEWELRHSPRPGIGLAAPQIGINKAVAIVRIPNKIGRIVIDLTEPIINVNLVNPILVEARDLEQYNEGCLSFPGQSVRTIRYNEIVIETLDDYVYHTEQINARRNGREPEKLELFTNVRRRLQFGQAAKEEEIRQLEQLVCVCVQHEFSHLLGLTMFDFEPQEVGRNDSCPCGSDKKNKKCHNYKYHNKNLEKLFSPRYKGV
jgi:peptide deformylase